MIFFNSENIKKLKDGIKINKKAVIAGGLLGSLMLSGCGNTWIFDNQYGFDKALILGDDSALVLDVEQWKDYSGEQIQLVTSNNFAVLTSSFDTTCFFGNSENYSVYDVGYSAVESDEMHHLTISDDQTETFNYDFFDGVWKYNKSITFNGNRALILPVGQWKDYSGEQLQVITNDGLALVLSSYNSKLVCDLSSSTSASVFAQSYVGSDGSVVDLSEGVVNNDGSYDFIDSVRCFNKAIIMKEGTCTILPIVEWCDYEGEQLQLKLKNGPIIVTAAYDTILVNDMNSKIKAIDIASALSDKVIDLAENYVVNSSYNRSIFDFTSEFNNAILSGHNTSATVNVVKWSDYEGEQLQIKLPTGDVILSSSIMMDLLNGSSSQLDVVTLADGYVSEDGKSIDKTNGFRGPQGYNRYIF